MDVAFTEWLWPSLNDCDLHWMAVTFTKWLWPSLNDWSQNQKGSFTKPWPWDRIPNSYYVTEWLMISCWRLLWPWPFKWLTSKLIEVICGFRPTFIHKYFELQVIVTLTLSCRIYLILTSFHLIYRIRNMIQNVNSYSHYHFSWLNMYIHV